eukprot:11415598-Alexandrium_andersonii.AAC.1
MAAPTPTRPPAPSIFPQQPFPTIVVGRRPASSRMAPPNPRRRDTDRALEPPPGRQLRLTGRYLRRYVRTPGPPRPQPQLARWGARTGAASPSLSPLRPGCRPSPRRTH